MVLMECVGTVRCLGFGVGDKDAFVFCCWAGRQAFFDRRATLGLVEQARSGSVGRNIAARW
jgi:hypothetical protein